MRTQCDATPAHSPPPRNGFTPFQYAVQLVRGEILRTLVETNAVPPTEELSSLAVAKERKIEALVPILMEARSRLYLHNAIRGNDLPRVRPALGLCLSMGLRSVCMMSVAVSVYVSASGVCMVSVAVCAYGVYLYAYGVCICLAYVRVTVSIDAHA